MEKFHIDEGKYKTKYYCNIYGVNDIDIEENILNEEQIKVLITCTLLQKNAKDKNFTQEKAQICADNIIAYKKYQVFYNQAKKDVILNEIYSMKHGEKPNCLLIGFYCSYMYVFVSKLGKNLDDEFYNKLAVETDWEAYTDEMKKYHTYFCELGDNTLVFDNSINVSI